MAADGVQSSSVQSGHPEVHESVCDMYVSVCGGDRDRVDEAEGDREQGEGFDSLAFSWEVKTVTLKGGRSLESDRLRPLICNSFQPRPVFASKCRATRHPPALAHTLGLLWSYSACTLLYRLCVVSPIPPRFLMISSMLSWSDRHYHSQFFSLTPPLTSEEEMQRCISCHKFEWRPFLVAVFAWKHTISSVCISLSNAIMWPVVQQ